MSYKKGYQKSSMYQRPSYKSCAGMAYTDAKRALVVARGVKRLLNVEIKNFDTKEQTVAIIDTPLITQISNIPQGDSTNSRDGAQCKVLGIELNYVIFHNASATGTIVRVMVICDKQTNQAIYSAADLLEDASIIDNLMSPYNLNNKHRFRVLYDRRHNLSSTTASITVKKFIKLKTLLRYDASTSAIADLTQNSLSILKVSNEVTNDPSWNMFCRVRYVDN